MKAMPLLVLAIAWPAHAQHHADAQVHAAPQSQPAPDPHAAHRATRQSQSDSAAAAHDADTYLTPVWAAAPVGEPGKS